VNPYRPSISTVFSQDQVGESVSTVDIERDLERDRSIKTNRRIDDTCAVRFASFFHLL